MTQFPFLAIIQGQLRVVERRPWPRGGYTIRPLTAAESLTIAELVAGALRP